MKHVITNAAEITILEVIDNTFKTGGGPVSVGGCVLVASKGPVMVPTQVRDTDWQEIFGKPLPKKSAGMEGLRHLADATPYCNYVNVIRVVAADAKYPSLALYLTTDKDAWATGVAYKIGDIVTATDTNKFRCLVDHTAATEPSLASPGPEWILFTEYFDADAHAYGTSIVHSDSDILVIYPVDGDPSVNRSLRIDDVDDTTKRFTLTILDKDDLGESYVLESYEVGLDPDDKDDMGRPAYIETVLEQQSDRFRCDFNEDLTWAKALETLQALENTLSTPQTVAFTGGTNGGEPTTEEWLEAAELLRNENIALNLLFAAGNYDTDFLAKLANIGDDRRCSVFVDVPPYLDSDAAIAWLTAAGIKSRHVRCYHAPFAASDPWRGGKTVWGASGAAATAKAIGNALFTGNVPGIHYAPAGIKRGVLKRTGIIPTFPEDILNRDDFYTARINPVIPAQSGGAVIDDDLTLHYMQNYSRFGWVNDILDYIEHRFLEAASYAKFEPDGLTYSILYDLTKEILDQLVTSGALVPPRNPEEDGTAPYVITIKQLEIDLWHVQWDICPTGAARRIAGQPRLIK